MKKPKAWLSVRDFGLGGVHHSGWWTSFFVFFDTADNMAIGDESTQFGKILVSVIQVRKSPMGERMGIDI